MPSTIIKKRNTMNKRLIVNDIESHQDEVTERSLNTPCIKGGWTFSIRVLGILTLLLLGLTQIILATQCRDSRKTRDVSTIPIVSKWRVTTERSRVPVKFHPRDKDKLTGYLSPGDIVEAYGNGTKRHIFLLHPQRGFSLRKGPERGKEQFEKISNNEYTEPVSPSCPLLYSGWWPKHKTPYRFLYAPTKMVVAQQFWNAMQVFELLLLISLAYSYPRGSIKFIAVCILSTVVTCLLPFSHYFINHGGHMFSYATLITCIWGIKNNSRLVLSIGDKIPAVGHRMVFREELIAFLCNLGCSLYNHNASRHTWPHWNKHFFTLDRFFGWIDGTSPGTMNFYTMGMTDVRTPMFVAGNGATTSGSTVFTLIWSVLPFIYVCYFGCLILLSSRSPYKNIQRGMCIFGIFHFLFFTDAVSYLYGRGFWTPTSEYFHWSERWAWRVAILVPIYQNCTNGHWIKGHSKKIVGKIVHYCMWVWGVLFLFQQVLCSDIFKSIQYVNGWEQKSLISMLGLPSHKLFSYHGALVVMCMMYGFMMVVGFAPYKVFLGKENYYTVTGRRSVLI